MLRKYFTFEYKIKNIFNKVVDFSKTITIKQINNTLFFIYFEGIYR